MQPTEILMNEHRVIEQVLNCLEAMTERALAERQLDTASARDAVDFFRNFADRCHHGKEEGQLFPLLERRGLPREGGPTGQMLAEHEAGRTHIRGIEEAIARAEAGDSHAVNLFASHARGYVELLREHIQKEDHCLFAMAGALLSEEDQQELHRQFETVEHEHMGQGMHEKYLKIADALADRCGVSRATVAAAHSGCGCAHGKHA